MSFSVDLSPYEIQMLDTRQLVTKLNGALAAIQAAVNAAGMGVFNLLGFFDASGGSYPTSPSANDAWVISVAGTISGTAYSVGDVIGYTGSEWVTLMSAAGDVDLSDPGPIGDGTPDTGAFTDLSASGSAAFNGSAPSGSGITALFASPPAIGGTAEAAVKATTIEGTDATDASSTTAAAMKTAGGLAVVKDLRVGGNAIANAYRIYSDDNRANSWWDQTGVTQRFLVGYNHLASQAYINAVANVPLLMSVNNVERLRLDTTGAVRPGSDDAQDLGDASFRWDDIFATNATIQTSDARHKESVNDVDVALAGALFDALRPVSFKWRDYTVPEKREARIERRQKMQQVERPVIREIDGVMVRHLALVEEPVYEQAQVFNEDGTPALDENDRPITMQRPVMEEVEVEDVTPAREKVHARLHYGLIAQEVEQALIAVGLDPANFAAFIYDADADIYGARYAELIAPMIALIKDLRVRVAALEGNG